MHDSMYMCESKNMSLITCVIVHTYVCTCDIICVTVCVLNNLLVDKDY